MQSGVGLLEQLGRSRDLAGLDLSEMVEIEVLSVLHRADAAEFRDLAMQSVGARSLDGCHRAAGRVAIFRRQRGAEDFYFFNRALDRISGIDSSIVIGHGKG